MLSLKHSLLACALLCAFIAPSTRAQRAPLDVGVAGHAFDHLGLLGEQAPAAVASGANIIYATGFGAMGYEGLADEPTLKTTRATTRAYTQQAKAGGVRLAIGYLCATSIVKLDTFDKNWTPEFRVQFSTPPSQWLQQGRDGKALASWYGGDYRPACMNNPDWRLYEKSMIRRQLETGHDGIFFDNPTVHENGCYCEHCMRKFAKFLASEGANVDAGGADVASLRQLTLPRPKDFLRFRCTIGSDFLADMRAYARTIDKDALMTCNNSLNAPEVFYSQCHKYGYNIFEMSKSEDLVVVEDLVAEPRTLADGTQVEYGPVYELLHAIAHGKPVVAVTLANDGDYHTPPNLARLAMAEAAAHGASYLSWPTWPQNVRQKMIDGLRPQADVLRQHADLLNDVQGGADAVVFLPWRRWVESSECAALNIVRALSRANVQFRVVCEENLVKTLEASTPPPALIVESKEVLTSAEQRSVEKHRGAGGRVTFADREQWLGELQAASRNRAIVVDGPSSIRAVVRTQANRTIVHLLNLDVRKISSFEDRVMPATNVKIRVRVRAGAKSVKAITADAEATRGAVSFTPSENSIAAFVELTVPRVDVSTILLIE